MKFTHENIDYRIAFSHETATREIPGVGRKEQRSTIARIKTENSTKGVINFAEAKVTAYYKDVFSLEEGRKKALTWALRMAVSYSSAYADLVPRGTRKAFRTAAWTAYHSRAGGLMHSKSDVAVA